MKEQSRHGIVLYDFLYCRGGAEQVTMDLIHGLPHTELCCAFRDKKIFNDVELKGVPCIELGGKTNAPAIRTIHGMYVFRHRTRFLSNYDWVIYSGSNAPAAVANHPKGLNIYYCHTIPRFVYDLKDYYLTVVPHWQRPALRALIEYVRPRYEQAISRMDVVIANSANVRNRIEKHFKSEATIVHPPCDVDAFRWMGQGDYYLSTARLEPYKRVDRIVEAFKKLPGHRLVVISGGTELVRIKRMAKEAKNIEVLGWITHLKMRDLIGKAIATVYIPKDEDFGMSPVESMAAGKPVIGVAEGGLLETVIDGKTGLLCPQEPTVDDIATAVKALTPKVALSLRRACEQRAQDFRKEIFIQKIKKIVSIQLNTT